MSDSVQKAEFTGILKLGELEIPCFVLEDKKRVIAQREILYLLTGNRKGGLDRYTKASGVREFMPRKYVDKPHKESVILVSIGSAIAYGYEAQDVIDICNAYLQARAKGKLDPSQAGLAEQAEIFIRACAKVGIEALIDEATGYQAVRDSNELQLKIQAYIAKELNEWTRTFPREFFEQLFRLEGLPIPVPPKPYPKRFGRYVMNFVYDTLDPDVANWLRENNPDPQWNKHHHQWLTQEFGQPKLIRHLMSVLGIMKASVSMETFRENLNRAFAGTRAVRRIWRKPKPQSPVQQDREYQMTFL